MGVFESDPRHLPLGAPSADTEHKAPKPMGPGQPLEGVRDYILTLIKNSNVEGLRDLVETASRSEVLSDVARAVILAVHDQPQEGDSADYVDRAMNASTRMGHFVGRVLANRGACDKLVEELLVGDHFHAAFGVTSRHIGLLTKARFINALYDLCPTGDELLIIREAVKRAREGPIRGLAEQLVDRPPYDLAAFVRSCLSRLN